MKAPGASGPFGVLPSVARRLPVAERGPDDRGLGDPPPALERRGLLVPQPLAEVSGDRHLHSRHRGVGSTCHSGSLAASQPPAEPADRADGSLIHDLQ